MPASKAQQTLVAERRAKVIQMKIAGIDNETIARTVGLKNPADVSQDVTRAFQRAKAIEGQEIDALKAIELARYDRAQAALWPKVLKGDLRAIDTFIRLSARRCRVLGLDAIQELKVLTMDLLDAELIKLRQEVALAENVLKEEREAEEV
jgi:hypothetical protein